jgi:hypothetical protein
LVTFLGQAKKVTGISACGIGSEFAVFLESLEAFSEGGAFWIVHARLEPIEFYLIDCEVFVVASRERRREPIVFLWEEIVG